jgi:hypothetical protein
MLTDGRRTAAIAGRTSIQWRLWMTTVTILALAAAAPLSAKRKDDTLVMMNGDRLVGEVKELSQGELRFKTAYVLDTFIVDWREVRELRSQDLYRVEVDNGERLTGTIVRETDGRFTVTVNGRVETFTWSDVLLIVPVETSFWYQLTGQISSGYTYTSGDSQSQFTASGSVGYNAERYAFQLSGSSNFSHHAEDDSSEGTSRNEISLLNTVPFRRNYFAVGVLDLLTSEQQDLDLRTTAGGGAGRWLFRTQHTLLAAFGGLVYTHEVYAPPDNPTEAAMNVSDNLEGLASLQYAFHRFKTTDIEAKFVVYPSFTTPGRVRISVGPTLNIEIAHNLYWDFTLYENYDSRPPVNANRNDFGVTNSFGWKF